MGELHIVNKLNDCLEILRADDEIKISGELWHRLTHGEAGAFVEATEEFLTVYGKNRTVVYEISHHIENQDVWVATKVEDEPKGTDAFAGLTTIGQTFL